MRWAVLTFAAFSGTLALPAIADDDARPDVMKIDAPSPSETDAAQPDWYRQFTVTDIARTDIESNPAIQSSPADEIRLEWLNTGRWQFSVDLRSRPEDSPLPREEMSAGATFQITPRISIGGDLSLGADELNKSSKWSDEQIEAGIKLRSAFKF